MYDVKLISKTMPVEDFSKETGCKDAEEIISYCARVSNPSNQTNFDTSDKLLNYCIKKKHWSIFTMADATFEINCTRDIGRQILRHWTADFQEFSQRYATPNPDDFTVRECRFQDEENRQNSIEIDPSDKIHVHIRDTFDKMQREHIKDSLDKYNWAIKNGIAKEQARVFLPEGNTPSVMYMKMNIRDWFHYCQLRMDNGTQKEHRLIATNIWNALIPHFKFLETIKVE